MFGFGKSVGIAFQLVDDILDYTGSEKELGKRPFQDLREGKVTLPLLHALRQADPSDREAAARALAKKEPGIRDVAFLAKLVTRHGGIEYTASRAKAFIQEGKSFLRALPASPARDALATLSDYVVSRTA
jgi:geranylgeranyl pyrophosphate synthase